MRDRGGLRVRTRVAEVVLQLRDTRTQRLNLHLRGGRVHGGRVKTKRERSNGCANTNGAQCPLHNDESLPGTRRSLPNYAI